MNLQLRIPPLAVGAGFIALAMVGFKRSLWLVVAALAAHGLFDLFHPHAFHNSGVPVWYPEFCFAYDVAAAVFLGWRLRQLKFAPTDSAVLSTTSGSSV
jgi:protein-S-isoprenylcysteine O-methyltransferase Ste14